MSGKFVTEDVNVMKEYLKETLSLKAAYEFRAAHGLESEVDEIRDLVIEWHLSYTSTLRRGYIIDLFGKRGERKRGQSQVFKVILRSLATSQSLTGNREPVSILSPDPSSRPAHRRNSSPIWWAAIRKSYMECNAYARIHVAYKHCSSVAL